jgi:hypothetical protein
MTMTVRYALLAYFAAAVAYVGYAAYSDSGLYRLAAEWQMQLLGPTSFKMKFMVPVVILMIPGAVIERIIVSRSRNARRTDYAFGSICPTLNQPPLSPSGHRAAETAEISL